MKLEDLFAKISKENLQKAKEKRKEIEDKYWGWEIDNFYRYFHDSFKMFFAQNSTIEYLNSMLSLVGEQVEYKDVIQKLNDLDFDKRFICLMEDGIYNAKFHDGPMHKWEWRNMAASCYSAKLAADSSIRYVDDILEGKLIPAQSMDYYEALFIYLWKVDEIRYGKRDEIIGKARQFGSPDVKKAYEK